jgi:hypothetical protein
MQGMNTETTLHLRRMIGFDDPRDPAQRDLGQTLADDLLESQWRIDIGRNNEIKRARARKEAARLADIREGAA